MKYILALFMLLVPHHTPAYVLVWSVPDVTLQTAIGCSYSVSASGGSYVPIQKPITCSAPPNSGYVSCSAYTGLVEVGDSVKMQMTCPVLAVSITQ